MSEKRLFLGILLNFSHKKLMQLCVKLGILFTENIFPIMKNSGMGEMSEFVDTWILITLKYFDNLFPILFIERVVMQQINHVQ